MTDISCKHEPDGPVHRFEDAAMGTRMSGHHETGRKYTPILCKHCKMQINVPGIINLRRGDGKTWREM